MTRRNLTRLLRNRRDQESSCRNGRKDHSLHQYLLFRIDPARPTRITRLKPWGVANEVMILRLNVFCNLDERLNGHAGVLACRGRTSRSRRPCARGDPTRPVDAPIMGIYRIQMLGLLAEEKPVGIRKYKHAVFAFNCSGFTTTHAQIIGLPDMRVISPLRPCRDRFAWWVDKCDSLYAVFPRGP